jgi:LysR family glycine cleavage system transcriptional activator
MASALPPLKALQTFEVAARKLSFSKAADELYVTQGAVSKQIKLLEEYLEQALFERSAGGLRLTDSGQEYLAAISESLELIRKATARVQQSKGAANSLKIDLIPSFSMLWLIPRLEQLQRELPELKLTQVVGDGPYRFEANSADLAIRCLPLSESLHYAELLISETLIPVIHPSLVESDPIAEPEDLLKHPLLSHITRPQLWISFLKSLGITRLSDPQYRHGFEHFYMSLEAARIQQGVALVPDYMAADLIAKGELVSPLDLRYPSGYGYYFLTPAYQASNSLILKLLQWIKTNL